MRNKKVVKILCVILAAAMPVSSGVGVQAAQAGAVAATADQTDDVQNAAETSAEDSAQNADSDDLEGSIQYLDDSAQTNNSDAQQDGNISSDQTPQQDGNATSDQASQDISGTIVQNEDSDNVTIKASDKPYLALGADLNDSQRATILSIMGIDAANLSNYDVVYVTNAEEHQYLDSYISSSQIGTRSLSSVVIVQRDKGSGLNISTTNINYCSALLCRWSCTRCSGFCRRFICFGKESKKYRCRYYCSRTNSNFRNGGFSRRIKSISGDDRKRDQ